MEDIIGKRIDSPYVAGRSRDWLKGKQAGFHDGWEPPDSSAEDGSLVFSLQALID